MITIIFLIIIYFSFFCLGIPDSLLGSAWPSMHGSLGIPLYYAGYISMIMSMGRVISGLYSERVIRRFGTGIVISAGFSSLCAAVFGFSVSSSFLMLCICAVPFSLGAGFVDVALNNHVALNYKAKHMNWLHCFWGVGASTGPLIMSFYLINRNSWNMGYRTSGIILCCLSVILYMGTSLWEKNNSAKKNEEIKTQKISYREMLNIPGFKQNLIVFFCYVSIQVTVILWGSSYLVMEKDVTPERAARWISLFYIGLTLGRFISGIISIKLNNRQIIRLGLSIIACGVGVLLIPAEGFVLPGFLITGLGCAPVFPCLLHETPKNFGNDKSQAVMGIQMACGCIGAVVNPPIFGKLAEYTGFFIFPAFIGLLLVMTIIMFELVNKKVDRAISG